MSWRAFWQLFIQSKNQLGNAASDFLFFALRLCSEAHEASDNDGARRSAVR
jgi:hypothetical protein